MRRLYIEATTLEVVDTIPYFFLLILYCSNSCRLCQEFASESLLIVLHRNGVAAFCIGRDINVEGHDVGGVDALFINGLARFISDAYLIDIVERVEIDP